MSRAEDGTDFPFMVLMINLVRVAFDALLDGKIAALFKSNSSVRQMTFWSASVGDGWDPFNVFYAGLTCLFLHSWRTGRKTIKDSGFVLKDLEERSRANPMLVISTLKQHLQSYPREEVRRVELEIRERS